MTDWVCTRCGQWNIATCILCIGCAAGKSDANVRPTNVKRCAWCAATENLVLIPVPVVSEVVPRQHECADGDACEERRKALIAAAPEVSATCRECGRKLRRASAGASQGWTAAPTKWVGHCKGCGRRGLIP